MIVRTRPLTTEEARRYVMALRAAPESELIYAAIAAIAIGTGARIGEVLAMRNGDVLDMKSGTVRARIRRKILKKRGQVVYKESEFCDTVLRGVVQRYVNFNGRKSAFQPADAPFFSRRWSGAKLTYWSAWMHNRTFLRAASIDPAGVAFHGLRKTFLSLVFRQIYDDGRDMLKALTYVQRLAGHENINTTIAYLDIQEVDEQRTIRTALGEITQENSQTS